MMGLEVPMFLLNPFEMVSFQGTCFLFWVGGKQKLLTSPEKELHI